MDGFLGKEPCDRCVAACRSFDALRSEEEGGPCHNCLNEDWRRSTNKRGHTYQIAGADVAHRDLAAVARKHVHAKQTLHDDCESFGVGFGVHGSSRREIADTTTLDKRFNRRDRQ